MVLYEVNIQINREIEQKYRTWLKQHIAEMLCFEGFISAEVFEEEQPDPTICKITIAYHVKDRKLLQNYLDQHATRMRADVIKHFGQQFAANRRILNKLD